jgi:hypothetical protein
MSKGATGRAGIALYPYAHLVRGTLLGELGRVDEAMVALGAADRARNTGTRADSREAQSRSVSSTTSSSSWQARKYDAVAQA